GSFVTPENESFYQQFHYDRLDPTRRDIRIIRLLPALRDGLIQCKLLPARPLSQLKNRFRALSYCAGDPSNPTPIFVSGLRFNVFKNLNQALSQVLEFWNTKHAKDEDCLLWVDQICIDQHSYLERSHQVGFMRNIYFEAKATFVCLASASRNLADDSRPRPKIRSIDWLNQLSNDIITLEPEFRYLGFGESPILRTLLSQIGRPTFLQGWLAFYDFIGSPWWSRSWVRQEFICSARVHFMHQDRWIDWDSLSKILHNLCCVLKDLTVSRYRVEQALADLKLEDINVPSWQGPCAEVFLRNRENADALAAIILLTEQKDSWRGDEDLKEVLALSRYCRSSDPRDRIYAFLGLAHPGYHVPVDYNEVNNLNLTLTDTAKCILSFENNLDIFRYAIATHEMSPSPLASWAPDWPATEYLPLDQFSQIPDGGLLARYIDPPYQPPVSRISSSSQDGGPQLQVTGVRFDSIKEHLPVFTNARFYSAFETSQGYTVRCRSGVQAGDELWVLYGGKWLFVLRP
ncbi:heterokaryon incompatibility protein-domain-containing protein, partial [Immersiella caudata]